MSGQFWDKLRQPPEFDASGFDPGMGLAVAQRTILRSPYGKQETWKDVTERVAFGNSSLCKTANEHVQEFNTLKSFIGKRAFITSGRHLQHGDMNQKYRNLEIFSNCSTSFTSFYSMYLLLNGSGVGRCYDDDLMLVDWDNMPNVICVLNDDHRDYDFQAHTTVREAIHKYGQDVEWIEVGDSREGWSHLLETLEVMAFEKIHKDRLVIADFSKVRPKDAAIEGMQGRPSSGPVPLMQAIAKVCSLKGARIPKWKQAMLVDHFIAESVVVGGVRRSARMSVKYWKDPSVFEFVDVKRPIEFYGLTTEQIQVIRKEKKPQGFLWSSNNSVLVDKEFWELIALPKSDPRSKSDIAKHALKLFNAISLAAYADGTGEPGLINVDQLKCDDRNLGAIEYGSNKFPLQDGSYLYLDRLTKISRMKQYSMIVNPCAEITLRLNGAFCVIGDVCGYFCDTIEEFYEVCRAAARFLIRTNLLPSVYNTEVKRTNRIGVGLTGIHEFAWKFFGYTFHDLLDEEKSQDFWNVIMNARLAVEDEAIKYSKKYGVVVPHTMTTIKPSGSVSKLFGLTEGYHLPAMKFYMRWVQFKPDNPTFLEYQKAGYPTRDLTSYKLTSIVGFPTTPLLTKIMPDELIVTAAEATPTEQYKWLQLGEKYWLGPTYGNQISYTLKYDPTQVTLEEYRSTLKEYQANVRCCSIMAQEDESSYEYLPEEIITRQRFDEALAAVKNKLTEDVDFAHIGCENGACPVDFKGDLKENYEHSDVTGHFQP
jgi:adenosylcobalamin-dependent ribonucleoside-triphosphate reductase